jgi:hypothetical protein
MPCSVTCSLCQQINEFAKEMYEIFTNKKPTVLKGGFFATDAFLKTLML